MQDEFTQSLFIPFHTCTLCGKSYPRTPDFFYTQYKRDGTPKGDGMRSRCKDCSDSAKTKGARISQECRAGKRAAYLPKDATFAECTGCVKLLPRTDEFFYRDTKGNLRRRCRDCCNADTRARHAVPKNRQHHHDRMRKNNFGLSAQEYQSMSRFQGGVCAICGQPERRLARDRSGPRNLSVDHDHKTGDVRGLLCGGCNGGLGYFCDSVEILEAAIKYLKYHRKHPDALLEPQGDMA